MAFVSPRATFEALRRAGWKDPHDTTVPGCDIRIKLNNGSYTQLYFRYDLPLDPTFYRNVHPEDLKKLRRQQLPEGQPRRTS